MIDIWVLVFDLNVTSAALPRTYSLSQVLRPPGVQTCSGGVAVVCSLPFTNFRAVSIDIDIHLLNLWRFPIKIMKRSNGRIATLYLSGHQGINKSVTIVML